MYVFFDALEQFDILNLLNWFGFSLIPTNLAVTHVICIILTTIIFSYVNPVFGFLFSPLVFTSFSRQLMNRNGGSIVWLYYACWHFFCITPMLLFRSTGGDHLAFLSRGHGRNFFLFRQLTLDCFVFSELSSWRLDLNNFWFLNLFFYVVETLYGLVASILEDNVLQQKNFNIDFIFFLFINILVFNLFGLFPFGFTVTSSFVVTLFFSLTVFVSANIMGIYHNSWGIFSLFLPGGTPLFIAPLLIPIEILSYISRIFSLSIRLFANMMSGHGLLKILIGFSFIAFKSASAWSFFGILPWIIVSVVFVLECAIAFLQAYVFIVLAAIYINDATSPH